MINLFELNYVLTIASHTNWVKKQGALLIVICQSSQFGENAQDAKNIIPYTEG